MTKGKMLLIVSLISVLCVGVFADPHDWTGETSSFLQPEGCKKDRFQRCDPDAVGQCCDGGDGSPSKCAKFAKGKYKCVSTSLGELKDRCQNDKQCASSRCAKDKCRKPKPTLNNYDECNPGDDSEDVCPMGSTCKYVKNGQGLEANEKEFACCPRDKRAKREPCLLGVQCCTGYCGPNGFCQEPTLPTLWDASELPAEEQERILAMGQVQVFLVSGAEETRSDLFELLNYETGVVRKVGDLEFPEGFQDIDNPQLHSIRAAAFSTKYNKFLLHEPVLALTRNDDDEPLSGSWIIVDKFSKPKHFRSENIRFADVQSDNGYTDIDYLPNGDLIANRKVTRDMKSLNDTICILNGQTLEPRKCHPVTPPRNGGQVGVTYDVKRERIVYRMGSPNDTLQFFTVRENGQVSDIVGCVGESYQYPDPRGFEQFSNSLSYEPHRDSYFTPYLFSNGTADGGQSGLFELTDTKDCRSSGVFHNNFRFEDGTMAGDYDMGEMIIIYDMERVWNVLHGDKK